MVCKYHFCLLKILPLNDRLKVGQAKAHHSIKAVWGGSLALDTLHRDLKKYPVFPDFFLLVTVGDHGIQCVRKSVPTPKQERQD